MNMIPRSNIAEWHITYRCNLRCVACNRCCFLGPAAKDMTLDDAEVFVTQCRELGWSPEIRILGGEPTLHHQFLDFLKIAHRLTTRVLVYSNAFDVSSKKLLKAARRRHPGCVVRRAAKPQGSTVFADNDYWIAPCDFGVSSRPVCDSHSCFQTGYGRSYECGISVDSGGYTTCPIGGAIDGILGLGVRTSRLADLFSPEFAAEQTNALCSRCGHAWADAEKTWASGVEELHWVRMSPTWANALRRLK